jgi:hypothetical protein
LSLSTWLRRHRGRFRLRQPSLPTKLKAMLDKHTTPQLHKLPGCRRRITDSRVLCCLDSPSACAPATSTASSTACTVLMHLNSSVMKRHGEVIDKFELFMRQSPHPLHRRRLRHRLCPQRRGLRCPRQGTVPLLGLNESSARPPGALITVAGPYLLAVRLTLLYAALCRAARCLRRKRVAVPSSTRASRLSSGRWFAASSRHAGACLQQTRADLLGRRQGVVWLRLRRLPPTITAGVSCEVDHSDCILAYFVNSSHASSVEIWSDGACATLLTAYACSSSTGSPERLPAQLPGRARSSR